jgi:hypothetical protein
MPECDRSALAMKRCALLFTVALWQGLASAQVESPEALLGSVEAVLFICGPLDAKTAKDGAEMQTLLIQQNKLDPTVVRKAPAYTRAYNTEVNRLLLLPPARKLDACKNVF